MLEWKYTVYLSTLNQESDYPKQHYVEMKCKCIYIIYVYILN